MSLELLELPSWRGSRKPTGRVAVAHLRPALENLEERTVMASPASLGQGIGAILAPVAQQASPLAINVTNVAVQTVDGVAQLVASGTIAGQQFTSPITLDTSPSNSDCPILHLTLGPINLNVLGLQVTTSPICLQIDASRGNGQLLGNLLCGLSHALDQPGGTLGGFLGTLSSTDANALLGGVTNLLNGALGSLTQRAHATLQQQDATTNVLHLEVGPLNLNLLGLKVKLDDCDNGPVTVDVNAVSGPGNLLGNLLSGVAHLADNVNVHALDQALARVARDLIFQGL